MRAILAALLLIWVGPVCAQEGAAQMDPVQSRAEDRFRRVELVLTLSQPVPYRVFTLDAPRRLVIDFDGIDFGATDPAAFTQSSWIDGARFGPFRDGWGRMIFDLSRPLRVDSAGMDVTELLGRAEIRLVLRRSSQDDFAAAAGAPEAASEWQAVPVPSPAAEADGRLVIVIDPGHGGIDPGAGYDDVKEADVMLTLAREVAADLERQGEFRPVLTRQTDVFVPLQDRIVLAQAARADLFLSLHADALEGEQTTGASVYTLSAEANDAASQRMVERHSYGELLAGVDLSGQGDEVAIALQDLLRIETAASADRFADHLVAALAEHGAVLNSRPRREAALAVLNAAEFPSVLMEAGFLSHDADRARLTSVEGRAPIVHAVTQAVSRWAEDQAALDPALPQ